MRRRRSEAAGEEPRERECVRERREMGWRGVRGAGISSLCGCGREYGRAHPCHPTSSDASAERERERKREREK